MVTSSGRQSKKVLNLQDPWCASHRAPQSATITFTELVYLTQLQVVSTNNEVSFSLYYDSSDVLYSNIGGANVCIHYYYQEHNAFNFGFLRSILYLAHLLCQYFYLLIQLKSSFKYLIVMTILALLLS